MERVKIKSVINTGRIYKDEPVIEVILEDGRKCTAFTRQALDWVGEIDVEIREGKEYQGTKPLYILKPATDRNSKNFMQKDWSFEKRRSSLEMAIKASELTKNDNELAILNLAEIFYNYLNNQ